MTLSKNAKLAVITASTAIILDQILKLWVHAHMQLNDHIYIIGEKFQLHYILNNGMAFGMQWGGDYGKLLLSLFRMVAVGVIIWYIRSLIKKNSHWGLIFAMSLILAGALGNIIDSMFYGILFQHKPFLFGEVIDMLYFPIMRGTFPSWVPMWGGEDFEFFRPIFNLADSCITTGVCIILVFQKVFFKEEIKAKD
jgi:signal peptidase II